MLDTSNWSPAARRYYEAELKSQEEILNMLDELIAEQEAKLAQQQTSAPDTTGTATVAPVEE
jgi:hypothetical protein